MGIVPMNPIRSRCRTTVFGLFFVFIACAQGSAEGSESQPALPGGSVQFASPLSGATVSGPVDIEVRASATVEQVDLYIDHRFYRSSPPYTWTWDSRAMPDGKHLLQAYAHDAQKLIGSASIKVTVSNAASFHPPVWPPEPDPPPTGPPSNGFVALIAPTTGTKISGTEKIEMEVSSSVAYVNIYLDPTFMASVTPDNPTADLDTTETPDGSHNVVAKEFYGSVNLLATDSALVMISNGPASLPNPVNYFPTLPPHAALPAESKC